MESKSQILASRITSSISNAFSPKPASQPSSVTQSRTRFVDLKRRLLSRRIIPTATKASSHNSAHRNRTGLIISLSAWLRKMCKHRPFLSIRIVQWPTTSHHHPKAWLTFSKPIMLFRGYKKSREFYTQQVEGLHEAKERIELEIEDAEEELQIFDDEIKQRETDRLDAVKASGLSAELMEAYDAFCESLNGVNGSQPRDGFSIRCDQPYGGSYFEYDPEFKFLKEFMEPERDMDMEFVATDEDLQQSLEENREWEPKTVSAKNLDMGSEMDSEENSEDTAEEGLEIVSEVVSEPNSESDSQRASEMVRKEGSDAGSNFSNFRCEASVSCAGTPWEEQIVEFWPLHRIEPRSGVEVTWGEQYPNLYRLALQAAKNGSESVMEMLIKLPSMNAAFSGWLSEYEFAEELKDEFSAFSEVGI